VEDKIINSSEKDKWKWREEIEVKITNRRENNK